MSVPIPPAPHPHEAPDELARICGLRQTQKRSRRIAAQRDDKSSPVLDPPASRMHHRRAFAKPHRARLQREGRAKRTPVSRAFCIVLLAAGLVLLVLAQLVIRFSDCQLVSFLLALGRLVLL